MMPDEKPITVLTYGTYDVLHRGHLRLLRRAKALGTRLIVGLSTDHFNRIKGKASVFGYRDRKLLLETMRFVDQVIPESNWSQKVRDIRRHQVDVFVMGDDWKGKFDHLKEYCQVIYLPRTRGISTTALKRLLAKRGLVLGLPNASQTAA
jgi:glycerol-3-phosphate cytidylyltransferase